MTYREAWLLIGRHVWGALGMALLFGGGMLLAIPVVRHEFEPLLRLPRAFARMLERILSRRPSTARLAAFIFLFNVCAIFLYMLTGVVPGAPAVVAVWTGLNVAAASILGPKRLPDGAGAPRSLPVTARLGAVVTFCLELPSLWFSLAMGMTDVPSILAILHGADATPLRERALAYGMVIAPALAVSALAEAHAVCTAYRLALAPSERDGGRRGPEKDRDASGSGKG